MTTRLAALSVLCVGGLTVLVSGCSVTVGAEGTAPKPSEPATASTASAIAPSTQFGGSPKLTREIDEAVAALASGSPIFNDPSAELALTSAEVEQLISLAKSAGVPFHIAVVSSAAKGDRTVEQTLFGLQEAVGEGGVYAIVAGSQFLAGSAKGAASDIATAAFNANWEAGLYEVLSAFITAANTSFGGGSVTTSTSRAEDPQQAQWMALWIDSSDPLRQAQCAQWRANPQEYLQTGITAQGYPSELVKRMMDEACSQ